MFGDRKQLRGDVPRSMTEMKDMEIWPARNEHILGGDFLDQFFALHAMKAAGDSPKKIMKQGENVSGAREHVDVVLKDIIASHKQRKERDEVAKQFGEAVESLVQEDETKHLPETERYLTYVGRDVKRIVSDLMRGKLSDVVLYDILNKRKEMVREHTKKLGEIWENMQEQFRDGLSDMLANDGECSAEDIQRVLARLDHLTFFASDPLMARLDDQDGSYVADFHTVYVNSDVVKRGKIAVQKTIMHELMHVVSSRMIFVHGSGSEDFPELTTVIRLGVRIHAIQQNKKPVLDALNEGVTDYFAERLWNEYAQQDTAEQYEVMYWQEEKFVKRLLGEPRYEGDRLVFDRGKDSHELLKLLLRAYVLDGITRDDTTTHFRAFHRAMRERFGDGFLTELAKIDDGGPLTRKKWLALEALLHQRTKNA